MKKKYTFLFIAVALILTSCRKENKTSKSQSSEESSISEESSTISEESSALSEDVPSTSEVSEVDITSETSEEDITSSEASEYISEEQPDYYTATFSHRFVPTDFSQGGGNKVINGLKWTYSSFTYLGGSDKGVQIGSKNNPQKTPWTIATTFPEGVKLTSITMYLANASGGSGEFTLNYGDGIKTNSFSSTDLVLITYDHLDTFTTDFSLTLKANSAAMYFYSLELNFHVNNDVSFVVTRDSEEGIPVVPGKNGIPLATYTPISKEDYYPATIHEKTGESLKLELRSLLTTMTKTSYDDARFMLQYTDENINNLGFLYGMWDGDDILPTWDSGASWQREHVWPASRMHKSGETDRPSGSTRNHATDLHNLRVVCPAANALHANHFLDEKGATAGAFYPNIASGLNGFHNYVGDHRGDVARIYFYMAVRYDHLSLIENIESGGNSIMGRLSALLRWHIEDPVDDFEIARNNKIYGYQGNRNPFIDYPELVTEIWS
ncbi:MAG TPA: endonuclease [Bacilli bacterium]|nr:endonuclease [Bacilli bacterium]